MYLNRLQVLGPCEQKTAANAKLNDGNISLESSK